MEPTTETAHVLVIDTDSYAGNFEREMTAFCTGRVGECGVGEWEAASYLEWLATEGRDDPFGDLVAMRPDEHGVERPTAIWPTPGRTNDGAGTHSDVGPGSPARFPAYESVAIFFEAKPSADLIDMIEARARDFGDNRMAFGEFAPVRVKAVRLVEERLVRTVEEIPRPSM